jgi:exosortase A
MPPDPAATPQKPHGAPIMPIVAAWRRPLAALAAAVLALIALGAREWGEMLHQWWSIDTYNHLLLVPFIIIWLVRLKASELARIVPQPAWPGLTLVALAIALWWAGRVSGINLFAHAGAVGAVQAAVVAVLGLRAALLLALPLAMAAFLVPFGDEIVAPLQLLTAEIAIALTRWSGVPATIEGIYINTPAGLFIVAEACSGVKFLIAMVTLAVLVCFTRFASWRRRALFLAACVIVPILANGVRAWATIYIAQFIGAEAAGGFDHIVYGWVFFALVVALLLGGAWRFFERDPHEHGWHAATLDRWEWLARAEQRPLDLPTAVMGIAGMAAIAAIAATTSMP